MKLPPLPFLALLLVLPRTGGANPPTPEGKPVQKWQIFAECRMVLLPEKLAIPVILQFGEPEKVNDAWVLLEQMVETGKAALDADLFVHGAGGKTLVSETAEERRFPTEFYPAPLPARLPGQVSPEILKSWLLFGVTPTGFEARNVGERLEFQAGVPDAGQWLEVQVKAVRTTFSKWESYDYAELPWGERLAISQPQFQHLSNESAFRLRNGEKILLGVHRLPDAPKTIELFVLQARATPAGTTP